MEVRHIGLRLPNQAGEPLLALPGPDCVYRPLQGIHPVEPGVVLHEEDDLVAHAFEQGLFRPEDGVFTAGLKVTIVDEQYFHGFAIPSRPPYRAPMGE